MRRAIGIIVVLCAASLAVGAGDMFPQVFRILDEGTLRQARMKLNFIGSTVSCVDNATQQRTDCTVTAGAPSDAKYITQTADATLSNEQALGSLATGIVKNTTTTGVLSIAASGTDYAPATSGSAVLLGNGSGGFSSYAGGSCTNQFVTATSTAGALTCTTPTLAGAQYANQGTTTTVLHGNAAGNPSWGQIAIADLSATGTPDGTTYLRGDNTWAAAGGGSGLTHPQIMARAGVYGGF